MEPAFFSFNLFEIYRLEAHPNITLTVTSGLFSQI